MQRNRILYTILVLGTVACGLLSRTSLTPNFLYPYLGDTLYATMIFFVLGFLFPTKSTRVILLAAITFCFCIELSQLYQATWLNSIRAFRIGALVLGSGFLWSDLVAYVCGAGLGAFIEVKVLLMWSNTK